MTQITKIRKERGDVITDPERIKRTVKRILWTTLWQEIGNLDGQISLKTQFTKVYSSKNILKIYKR